MPLMVWYPLDNCVTEISQIVMTNITAEVAHKHGKSGTNAEWAYVPFV